MKLPSFCLLSSLLMGFLAIQLITVVASSGGGGGGGGGGVASATTAAPKKYNAMFTFGDSMEETGNICAASSNKTELDVLTCTHPPYGESYFGKPSCRWCDGRVVVDFIAQALGLPLLPPSKAKGKDFWRGVSMAITGGTAMNFSFYKSLGIEDQVWNHGSLDTQIQWFKELMPSICGTEQTQALGLPLLPPSKAKGKDFRRGVSMAITGGTAMNFSFYKSLGIQDQVWNHGSLDTQIQWFKELMPSICGTEQSCKGFLKKSLFMFGAYGGNDYNVQLLEVGLTPEQAMQHTPKIVTAIANGVKKLIALGAVHIVVPGIFPTGCLPIFLSLFGDAAGEADFDQAGCLRTYNRLTEYHNTLLRTQVGALQRKHYNSTRLMYADFSGLVYQIVQEPEKFGFSAPFEACCGAGGGKYNFDVTARCGMEGATMACEDPSARLSWDGIHPTEALSKVIAGALLRGPYCFPPILG